ncbi:MAG: right-handed parallel beta-helix repeat-containing protein [Candidatus Lokiarchaeota archaeon]|nr:right-handed parallel beta-helix repeat-containing protein [Candidatus Lokiarchaeota archaeon]
MKKSNQKPLVRFGVIISILLFSSILFSVENIFKFQNISEESENRNINNSATESPIFIDATATGVGAHNWSWAKTQTWCSGEGTWGNPYVIEDLIIDGGGTEYCIKIQNSNAIFKIENCTLSHTAFWGYTDDWNAGIKLVNTSNGIIKNNTLLSSNQRNGILLYSNCNNNTILDNSITGTTYAIRYGIRIINYCNENRILYNNLTRIYSHYPGLIVSTLSIENNCNYNLIEGNRIIDSEDHAIYLYNYCENNIIRYNDLIGNGANGLFLHERCSNNEIYNNTIIDNNYGIRLLGNGRWNDIYYNNVSYNNYGIDLDDHSDDTDVYENTIDYNQIGIISEGGSFNIIINKNIFINNTEYGIYFDPFGGIEIYENTLYGSGIDWDFGAWNEDDNLDDLILSTNNTINDKPIYFFFRIPGLTSADFPNAGQIILVNCSNPILEDFIFKDCSVGIHLHFCDNPIIRNVSVSNGDIGIRLYWCDNYDLSDLSVTNQETYAIEIYKSQIGKIYDSILSENNGYGLNLGDSSNRTSITNVTANHNGYHGISIGSSHSIINNCTANFNGDNGFQISGNNITITNNYAFNNTDSGIEVFGSDFDIIISDNEFKFNIRNGIGLVYGTEGVNVSNNIIYGNIEDGIHGEYDAVNNIIFHNDIYNNKGHGISFGDESNDNKIINNSIYNSGLNGIYIYDNSLKNNITFNTIYNSGLNGIYIYSYSENTIIYGNIIDISRESGINIQSYSYNTSIIENSIYYSDKNGIILQYSGYANISSNEIHSNKLHSINIAQSGNNVISDNNMSNGAIFLQFGGNPTYIGTQQIDLTNHFNNKIIYYYKEQDGLTTTDFSNAGQIILYNCSNIEISNEDVSFGSIGISLFYCINAAIDNIISSFNVYDGIFVYNCSDIDITNSIMNNNSYGISIYDDYNINNYYFNISNNVIQYNSFGGIGSGKLYGSIISNNNICFNAFTIEDYYIYFTAIKSGIGLYTSSNNEFFLNNISYNYRYGLYFQTSINNKIISNIIENNTNNGITFDYGYMIENNIIRLNSIKYNLNNGISLDTECYNTIFILNNISLNKNHGIKFWGSIYGTNNNTITQNQIIDNGLDGIYLMEINDAIIIDNLIQSNGAHGLDVWGCENCTIYSNEIYYNDNNGIYVEYYSDWINISLNNIKYNLNNGIAVNQSSIYNNIEQNNISLNQNHGIYIWSSNSTSFDIIISNQIMNNGLNGIYTYEDLNITITYNLIQSNVNIGLFLNRCGNSTIYNNSFIGNSFNAMDNGIHYNAWDNGEFGNYWDDYMGQDLDNNSIGDTPYYILGTTGSIDNFPLMNPATKPEPPTPLGNNDDDNILPMIGIIFAIIAAISLIALGLIKQFSGKPNKKIKEPKLGTYSGTSEAEEISTQNIGNMAPSETQLIKPESYLNNDISLTHNKNYQAIVNQNPELKEYLETDKLISEIPEMKNFITTLSDPELMRKINLLGLTMEETGILIEDLVNLNPEERTLLIEKMLKNL